MKILPDTEIHSRPQITGRLICALLSAVLLLSLFSGCADSAAQPPYEHFTSIRDIPDVTQEEIDAIAELREQGASYMVKVPHGIELFTDESGRTRGYTVLLCDWLTTLFEIPFEAEIEELGVIVQELNAGKPGFASLVISEERQQNYFMTDSIAQRSVKIMRLEDSQPGGLLAQSRPPRYVFLEGTMMMELFANTLEPDSYVELVAENYEDVYRMMQSGEADAFIGNNTMEIAFDHFGGVITEEFLPLTFIPVGLAAGDQNLEPIITVLTKALRNGAYNHLAELYRQGHEDYRKHRFIMQLTDEEKDYIRNNPEIPFASQYMAYPVSFYNRNEQRWDGVVFDVLSEIEQLSGLSFKLVNDTTTELLDLMLLLDDGTAYFMPNLIQSEERRDRFLWSYNMYLTDRYALLSKQSYHNIELNDIPFEKVGFARGSAFADVFRSWFPNAVFAVEYPNTDSTFAALDRGEIDLVMSSQSRLSALTNYYEFSDYKANYLFDAPFEASFGVNKNHETLLSIIDKALPLIDTDRILEQWQSRTYDYQTRLMRERQPWLVGTSILATCVLALITVLFLRSRSSGRKLERIVRHRTDRLQSEITQRKAAEEEAKAASEAKSTFLATMSHEIRTPMNSIMGFAELARDSADAAPQIKDYLSKITDNTGWLLRIINDILDISKIEAGKMELESVPFSLHEVFSRCQSVILPTVKGKGLDLRVYTEPTPGRKTVGDPVRLYQALMNLLSNAVKFTDTGTVSLISAVKSCTAALPGDPPEDDGCTTVYFEVRDSGVGMSTEQIDKIFHPFIQADSSTTRNYGGTGLGLTIAKNIVELMGGKLAVDSKPGVGSAFSFELVFETIRTTEELPGRTDSPLIEKPYFSGLVLVCDDNTMNQEVLCEHLLRVGIQTQVADNGKAAVDIVSKRAEDGLPPFDLIFMDMFMPVMDGMEAAAIIKNMDTGTPIVAMTANIMKSELERYKEQGIPDCLGKPFTSQELWSVLLKYLKHIEAVPAVEYKNGNDALQKKLRASFVKNNQNTHARIEEAVTAGDIKLAHRLAHTLKGSAGLIGKTRLANAADEVESLLKGGLASVLEHKMITLKIELDQVLVQLGTLPDLPAEDIAAAPDKASPPDREQVMALFEKLEPLLENINPECAALVDDILAIPGAQELARQIRDYDFESAAESLTKLKTEWTVEND